MSVLPPQCHQVQQPRRLRPYRHRSSQSSPPQSRRPCHPYGVARKTLHGSGLPWASDAQLEDQASKLSLEQSAQSYTVILDHLEYSEDDVNHRSRTHRKAVSASGSYKALLYRDMDTLVHAVNRLSFQGVEQSLSTEKLEVAGLNSRNSQSGREPRPMTPHSPFKQSPCLRTAHRAASVPEFSSRITFGESMDTMNGTVEGAGGLSKCPAASPESPVQDPGTENISSLEQAQNTGQRNDSENDGSESSLESDMEDSEAKAPQPPLAYQIPPNVLSAAQQALPNTRASYWSQLLYRGPKDEKITLHYCSKLNVAERVAKHFLHEKVIGFDMEWKPYSSPASIKQNVSLIQIACEDRIALFHISQFFGTTPAQLVPPSLKAILENPDIYKVGVNIKGDFTRLQKHLGITGRGILELSRMHNLVERPEAGNRLCRLAIQVQQHLLLPLYKGETLVDEVNPTIDDLASKDDETAGSSTEKVSDPSKSTAQQDKDLEESTATKAKDAATTRGRSVRESDWTRALDRNQIYYAADDAYAGFRLFDVLNAKRKKMEPIPPLPQLSDNVSVASSAGKKSRASRKQASDTTSAKARATPAVEGAGEDEEYETAPEQSLEDDEDGLKSESALEPTSESSGPNDDSDSDYVPSSAEQPDVQRVEMPSVADSLTPSRRAGRPEVSKLLEATIAYPVLPVQSDLDAITGSDKSSATSPMQTVSSEEDSDEEFADSALEEALLELDIDQFTGETRPEDTCSMEETNGDQRDSETIKTSINTTQSSDSLTPAPGASSPVQILEAGASTQTDRFSAATAWAQEYLSESVPEPSLSSRPSGIRATTSHLRAYYLWHYMGMPVEDIAKLLREPPLAQSTVGGYILQAVSLEKLEFDEQKLRDVLETVPASVRVARWGHFLRKLSG